MSNSYYNGGTVPAPNDPGASAAIRAEFAGITAGFDKLPDLTGGAIAGDILVVNPAGDGIITAATLTSVNISGVQINASPIGGVTPSTGAFTSLSSTLGYTGNVTGNVTSTGASSFSSVTISGGTIDNAPIGATTAQTIRGTTITATVGFTGNVTGDLTGNVTGNVTGDLTGDVTGDVTGGLTGNVTATSGTSTFNNVTINGTLDMNSGSAGTITGLASPVNDSDAANKQYVDNSIQGLDAKASCRVATTANITLSGTQTIDGVALSAGQRVLVKNQSTASQNGIYVVAAGAWSRAPDADTWDELVHAFTFVESGTANANNGYVCTVTAGGTLGSTSVTWVQFSGAGQITAGTGMSKTGNTLNVNTASASRIVVNADDIDLAASGVTPSTYKSVTVDSYGRVTSGSNPTTLSGFGITDAYTITQIDALFGSTTSAANSAAAAAASASAALASEGAAASSASAAASSASAAQTSANNAAASYDLFDDRFLGAKTSDPSVDNDGNALVTGALYFNSSTGAMRVYNGSSWQDVAPTATSINLATQVTGTLSKSNGGTGQTTYTNGQLLIGNTTGNTLTKATLTAGAGVIVTNGAGSITVAGTNSDYVDLGNVSGTVNIDFTKGVVRARLIGNTTFAFTSVPASGTVAAVTLMVVQDGTGGRTVTWPAASDYPGGVVPPATTAANALDIWTLFTVNGGTAVYVSLAMKDAK